MSTMITVKVVQNKITKGTVRYGEPDNGQPLTLANIYIPKWVLAQVATAPGEYPQELEITIKPVGEEDA